MINLIRRALPLSLVPLAILAGALASAPWLRSFPASTMAVPLFGAAILSVLVPLVIIRLGLRRLLITAVFDGVAFVLYALVVVLREPTGFRALGSGLVHGPAQVLTFALPLVSPRSLLIPAVALCWLTGAIAGESIGRARASLLPYVSWFACFGLAYAGTARAGSFVHGGSSQTLLAAALLVTLAVLRMAQTWVGQDAAAQATEPDSALPLRGLVVGLCTTLVIVIAASYAVRSPVFGGSQVTPQRVPAINQSTPVTPLAFVSGLRPVGKAKATSLFEVTLEQSAPAYISLASVDLYDGDSWSFDRTFRPSGGVVPADVDPTLDPGGPLITQHYRIQSSLLTEAPWMPFIYRPSKVDGVPISVDLDSGMIVPTDPISPGTTYTVQSAASTSDLDSIAASSLPATSAPPIDLQIPAVLRDTLTKVVTAFTAETGKSPSPPLPFLQAMMTDLQKNYGLAGGTTAPPSTTPKSSGSASASPTATGSGDTHTGGTSFADVLASILGPLRSATPEQYATLFALVARQIGVPARVVSGFHLGGNGGPATVRAGTYEVTSAEATTWVEIPVRGAGWVVVNPAPSTYANTKPTPSVGASQSTTPSTAPTQNALATATNAGHAVAPKSSTRHFSGVHHSWFLPAALTIGLLLIVLLAFLLLRKSERRRRRRRHPDPRIRLIGAWHESLDVLEESGLHDLDALTGAEVTADTGMRFGPESATHVATLGDAANIAIYSPTTVVDAPDADAAWQSERALRTAVRRALPLRTRILATLRYHRQPRHIGPIGPASWAQRPEEPTSKRKPRRH